MTWRLKRITKAIVFGLYLEQRAQMSKQEMKRSKNASSFFNRRSNSIDEPLGVKKDFILSKYLTQWCMYVILLLKLHKLIWIMNDYKLKPWYSEQIRQTIFVHYIEWFTTSNVICLVNAQNGSWVLFTILQNLLYQGSLYQVLSVLSKLHLFIDLWNLHP